VLLPIIDRLQDRGQTVVARANAAFALPTVYEALERRKVRYAIRLPANDVLMRQTKDLLTWSRGRPSHAALVRYRSFQYQAASWEWPRRVIAKVERRLGELFPRVGFVVTNLTGRTWRSSISTTNMGRRSSEPRPARKPFTGPGPNVTASGRMRYGCSWVHLGNLLRRFALPRAFQIWSLTSLQQPPRPACPILILQPVDSHLTPRLFGQILGRIERLAWHPT
jgi:hypothetical protein